MIEEIIFYFYCVVYDPGGELVKEIEEMASGAQRKLRSGGIEIHKLCVLDFDIFLSGLL